MCSAGCMPAAPGVADRDARVTHHAAATIAVSQPHATPSARFMEAKRLACAVLCLVPADAIMSQ